VAKRSRLTEVVDATRSVAGAALGAAAGAGAEVVVENAASAMSKGARSLGAAAPRIKRAAANTVSKPLLVPSGTRLEFGGAISGNMRLSF